MSLFLSLTRGAELPDRTLTWEGSTGTPVDFAASPHTFKLDLPFSTPVTAPATLTKTTGITGNAQGLVTIAFAVDETDDWPAGVFRALLWARRTSDSKDREPARITVQVR